MRGIFWRRLFLGGAAIALALTPCVALAKKSPPPNPASPAATDKKPQETPPGWRSRCEAGGRNEPLNCAVEETAVLAQTGQVIVAFTIRVPNDTRTPLALIQIPVGVFLPNGIQLQIDDGNTINLPLQTCEQRGCFAGTTLAPDVLERMRAGKSLKVGFTNLNKQTLTVTLPLNGFGPAFDKIK